MPYDIVTIGTATRDIFLQSHLFRPVSDPHFTGNKEFPTGEAECFAFGGKIEIPAPIFTIGGGALNAAVTFARLGFRVASSFTVGKDHEGKMIRAALKTESVTAFPRTSREHHTAYSTILLSDRGERTILVYRGASEEMGRARSDLMDARYAYIVPGAFPFPRVAALFRKLHERGVCIAMNPSGHYIAMGAKKMRPLLEQLTVLIINREEAASLSGASYDDESHIMQTLQTMTPGIIVVTDGARGVTVVCDGQSYHAPIFKEQHLLDRTGAGDAFGSGFVAGLMHGRKVVGDKLGVEDIQYAIRLGSANATSVVERVGSTPGILTKELFANDPRWQTLDVRIS